MVHTICTKRIILEIELFIQDIPGVKVSILECHSIGHSNKNIFVNMYPLPNFSYIWGAIFSFPPSL
jgi:hypothetical protein